MTAPAPRHSRDVVDRRVAGETFLVPVRGRLADLKGLYALNEVGSFLWERIDGQADAAALARAVEASFEVAPEVAAADTAELLAALRQHGLVEEVP